MGLSRRKFTREFKLDAIERLESGASVAAVARALEVSPGLLQRWRQEFRESPGAAFCGRRQAAAGPGPGGATGTQDRSADAGD